MMDDIGKPGITQTIADNRVAVVVVGAVLAIGGGVAMLTGHPVMAAIDCGLAVNTVTAAIVCRLVHS